MKLSVIRQTLEQIGVQPTKTLGQNFLHDQNLAQWIVDQVEIEPTDLVVEIGPGLGALTEFIAPRCASAVLIEKDGRLVSFLRERFKGKTVEVVRGDAAAFDIRPLFACGPVKVVGNLPYYVSSQILFNFTTDPTPVTRLVFTLQKELARRLSACPSTKDYGALTLIIQRRWKVKYLRTLPASVFVPEPKVDSAIVLLTARQPGEVADCDGALFSTLVKQGFSQRRKQLRKNLANWNLDWPAVSNELGFPPTVRAEALSLGQWIRLTNRVSVSLGYADPGQAGAQDVHGERFDVVDDTNRVIGTASRYEVHRDGLNHRAVHIFVFDDAGNLYLQKRSRWKDRFPGRWDSSASGHLNAGQTYHDTAMRELVEELGVEATLTEIAEIAASPETGFEFVKLYTARHSGPFCLAPAEIECGGFFPLEVIERWTAARPQDFAPGFIRCYQEYQPARQHGPVQEHPRLGLG